MKSLLQKAQDFKKASGSDLGIRSDFVFDQSSGISEEDQKSILLHIDKVAQSNRILSGPDTWKVQPRKSGIGLPVVVNLVGALVLAGGLFGLGRIFAPRQADSGTSSVQLSSAEGRLLQEIKREAEGRLLEKDREISVIQDRMASLDEEKKQLLASVETRIQAKEKELEDQLKAELDRERARLIAQGLSEAAIQDRLREFEQRKTEEFRVQLAGFARKAEEERVALQENLDKARAEYMRSLSDATVERQRIQDDARAREQQLKAQLDDKNAALEAERAKAADSLRSARAELARLNEEAARVQAAEARLLGLYASARQSLREGRLDDAARTLSALRAYLADPQVAAIPALLERRELDSFAADLIEKAIGTERAKASVDTSRLSAALDALAVVRDETGRARAAVAAGDRAAAAASYRAALGATSELAEAGAFIDAEWNARLAVQAAEAEAALAATSTRTADATKVAVSAIDAAARDDGALPAAFDRLLANLPLGPGDAARVYAYVKNAGAREAEASRRAADTSAADGPYRAGAADFAAGRFVEAIQNFTSILARFPSAGQAPLAADGITRSGTGLAAALQESRALAAERVAELEVRLAESAVRAAGLEARLASAETETAGLRERLASLEGAAPSVAATPPDTAPDTATAGAPGAPSSAEYAALQEEKAKLEAELAEARARYEAVNAAYLAYAADEDVILERGGQLAMVDARARLDAFLSSEVVAAAMPGMRDRIAAYLTSFQAAGQREILFNAADIVEGAARIRDQAVRARYFADIEKRYSSDPAMLEFLTTIRESLQ